MTEEERSAAPGPEASSTFSRKWHGNVEGLVVAFTFALIIRCFFLEVFQIPTTSMEPTLLGDIVGRRHSNSDSEECPFVTYHGGDSSSGDRIMVTKFYYGVSRIDRWDIVVFRYPLNVAKNFIKRVVGLPGEEFLIYQGNVYTHEGQENDKMKFRIARKPPEVQKRLWIRAEPVADVLLEKFDTYWNAEPPQHNLSEGDLEVSRPTVFTHRGGVKDYPGGMYVNEVDDLRLALDLKMGQGTFFTRVVNRYGTFEARLFGPKGSVFVYRNNSGSETSHDLANIHPDAGFHRLELEIYDGQYIVRYDGKDALSKENKFIETRADAEDTREEHRIGFGSIDAGFTVRNLTLDRDVHYETRGGDTQNFAEDTPKYVPPGHYIVMGDNTRSSQDSRRWQRKSIRLKDGREIVFAYDSNAPRYKIAEDRFGESVDVKAQDVLHESPVEPFPFVSRDYIVGRALWIWFPRFGRLIR